MFGIQPDLRRHSALIIALSTVLGLVAGSVVVTASVYFDPESSEIVATAVDRRRLWRLLPRRQVFPLLRCRSGIGA